MKLRILTLVTLSLFAKACTSDQHPVEEPVYPAAAAYDDQEASQDETSADAAEAPMMAAPVPEGTSWNTERYRAIEEQGYKSADATPLSTFSIDVDTAGYSLVRRFLTQGNLPPQGAVRIEEMLNYFDYAYEGPTGDQPFAVHTTVSASPWDAKHQLVRIGIKGKEMPAAERPDANLVFLIDVSGSMDSPDKLPLLKRSMELLVDRLGKDDKVGIVVYAGAAGVVLEPTSDPRAILQALDRLSAGGSTNGGEGIEAAYKLAQANFKKDGINRIILATDGDFNVGNTNESTLVRMIEKKAESGVFLSVLGFGDGNYNDSTMEQLADKGNGNYAYLDTIDEARKVLVQQLSATLVTIAKDVKIQVEFNPELVDSYRLIGYENRALAAEDFNDDKKDAGEIGAGHSVTALYEIIPKGGDSAVGRKVDALRYGKKTSNGSTDELLTVKIRFKRPDGDKSTLLTSHVRPELTPFGKTDPDFRFAAAVAGFGLKLRGSADAPVLPYSELIAMAKSGLGEDEHGFRAEFLSLVRKADTLGH